MRSKKPVYCTNCGFLTHKVLKVSGPLIVDDRTAAPPTLSPADRDAVRHGTYTPADLLICHLRLTDYTEGHDPSRETVDDWGDQLRGPDYEHVKQANAAKTRSCPEFFSFRPGRSPLQHVDLSHKAEQNRWELRKSFLIAVIGGVVGAAATPWLRGWYDYFQALH